MYIYAICAVLIKQKMKKKMCNNKHEELPRDQWFECSLKREVRNKFNEGRKACFVWNESNGGERQQMY